MTNSVLHLPAIAHEAGLVFTMSDIAAVFEWTPLLADLQPGGRYWARDLHEAGGVPTVLRAMRDAGVLHEDCPTITGLTIGQIAAAAAAPGGDVVRGTGRPIASTGGLAVLCGNPTPDGAMLKVAGLAVGCTRAGPSCSKARLPRSRPFARRLMRQEMSWSCATKALEVVPVCARC